jgi:hypothetical protein
MKKTVKIILCVMFVILFPVTALSGGEATVTEFIDENFLKDCVILNIGDCNSLAGDINKIIDLSDEKIAPFLENSTTMLPLRFVAEAFDANVGWVSETMEINVSNNEINIQLAVGRETAEVNGVNEILPEPVIMRNSRTFVPMRFLCETSGYSVEYYDGTIIVSKEPLSEEQIQFALELAGNGFNREEILTVTDKAGFSNTLKFSHGKSIIKENNEFVVIDKNYEEIHNFKTPHFETKVDELIWDNNDGMIWAEINYLQKYKDVMETGLFLSPSPILHYPYGIGYYLYDNNGNYMNIEATEIAPFENGVATVTRAWTDDVVTIDTKGRIVE